MQLLAFGRGGDVGLYVDLGAVELPRLPIGCGVSDTVDEAGTDRIKLNTILLRSRFFLVCLAVGTAQSHAAARAPETYSDSPHLYRS